MATGQMYRLTVSIGGVNLGTMEGMSSGGGGTAPTSKSRPGGLGKEFVEKAPVSYDDMTVTYLNQNAAIWATRIDWLLSVAGTADWACQRQPIDPATKKAIGEAMVYTGTFNGVTPGTVDPSDSATESITLTAQIIDAVAA